jgi:hypothetical protein
MLLEKSRRKYSHPGDFMLHVEQPAGAWSWNRKPIFTGQGSAPARKEHLKRMQGRSFCTCVHIRIYGILNVQKIRCIKRTMHPFGCKDTLLGSREKSDRATESEEWDMRGWDRGSTKRQTEIKVEFVLCKPGRSPWQHSTAQYWNQSPTESGRRWTNRRHVGTVETKRATAGMDGFLNGASILIGHAGGRS